MRTRVTRGFRVGVVVAIIGLAAVGSAKAGIITAIEPNNTFATAQNINGQFQLDFNPNIGTGAGGGFVNTSTTIPHVTILRNNPTGGLDYFGFTTLTPGIIILDIDSSATNPAGGGVPPQNVNFDTMIHLFNAAGAPLATSDDNGGDPGDTPGAIVGGAFNSRIQTGVLPAGDYVVGVAAFFSTAGPGGVITGAQIPLNGTYTLHVSGNAEVIPEPATLALLGTGLIGLLGYGWRRRRANVA